MVLFLWCCAILFIDCITQENSDIFFSVYNNLNCKLTKMSEVELLQLKRADQN